MKAKIIIIAMILLLCATALAFAQEGRIWGTITYKNCTPDARDMVSITRVSDGVTVWTGGVIIPGGPHYSTYPPNLIPYGTYYVTIDFWDGSECDHFIRGYLVHNNPVSRCDLIAIGPTGDPDSPDGP
jgi:hypothetical protein